jgi:hypothetical protein
VWLAVEGINLVTLTLGNVVESKQNVCGGASSAEVVTQLIAMLPF